MSYSGSSEEEEGQTPAVSPTCDNSTPSIYKTLCIIAMCISVLAFIIFAIGFIKSSLINKIVLGIAILALILMGIFLGLSITTYKKCPNTHKEYPKTHKKYPKTQ